MFARELTPVLGPAAALAVIGSMAQTFTCAGTTQATATAITTANVNVTTATEGQGAILPPSMTSGDFCRVCNATSVSIYVYPPVGGQINGSTVNLPMMLSSLSAATFTCVDGFDWMANK